MRPSFWTSKAENAWNFNYHCYAESRDGIHWERPILNLFPFRDSTENNITSCYADNLFCPFFVFKDKNPACPPEERYKSIFCCFHAKYGGHALLAVSAVSAMGESIGAFDIIGNLFYPMALLLSSLVFIFILPDKKKKGDSLQEPTP